MTRIPVEKADGVDASPDTGELTEQIRQLAYYLFESRGGVDGGDIDDWLKAERELILTPETTIVQRDGKLEIRISAAGFDARDVRVTASPGSLVVKAASKQQHDGEIGRKIMLRTIELPEPIDIDRTTARLDNGVLFVTALRQNPDRQLAAV